MRAGIVRLIEEDGKILALVDPFQVTTREEAASFYEAVLVACIKEMSRRAIGETLPLPALEDTLPDQP
ncbi:MAG: hypothetical protein HY268_24675 [Deltaproteobacteria bacterium]|nr:hypothetical protein [Deltaproteobacteria bacterium]